MARINSTCLFSLNRVIIGIHDRDFKSQDIIKWIILGSNQVNKVEWENKNEEANG